MPNNVKPPRPYESHRDRIRRARGLHLAYLKTKQEQADKDRATKAHATPALGATDKVTGG
jgi:hypothetical protein